MAVNHLTDVQQSKLKGKGGLPYKHPSNERENTFPVTQKGFSPQNNILSTLEVLWLFVYIEVTYHPTKILVHRNMYKHMIIISSL